MLGGSRESGRNCECMAGDRHGQVPAAGEAAVLHAELDSRAEMPPVAHQGA